VNDCVNNNYTYHTKGRSVRNFHFGLTNEAADWRLCGYCTGVLISP